MHVLILQFGIGAVLGVAFAGVLLHQSAQQQNLQFGLMKLPSWFSTWSLFVVLGLLMGGGFALNARVFGIGMELLYWQSMTAMLFMSAVYDVFFRVVPLGVLALMVLVALLSPLIVAFPLPYPDAYLGALLVGGLVLMMYLITGGKGIGEADVVLAGVIGLLFGWMKGLLVFAAANFLGLFVVGILLFFLGKNRVRQIPLVFFLAIAIFAEWQLGYTDVVIQLFRLT